MGPIPDSPFKRDFQNASFPIPMGDTAPTPVTTTRFFMERCVLFRLPNLQGSYSAGATGDLFFLKIGRTSIYVAKVNKNQIISLDGFPRIFQGS
jgi:hypothetical protein